MYKSIYKCPLCGKTFFYEASNYGFGKEYMPTGCMLAPHKCDDGRQGLGQILGTVEIKDEEFENIYHEKYGAIKE